MDLEKIDEVLGGLCGVVSGSFTGTAAEDTMDEQVINLGFQPKAVFTGSIPFNYSPIYGYNTNCVLIYPGINCVGSTSWDSSELELTETGFRVAGLANYTGITYQYLAIR